MREVAMSGPLHGVKVIEMGVWVAGPAATGLMADWGADVIKVEPPAGDPQRFVFGALGVADQKGVPPFEIDNRGKRSVVLDLRDDGDLQKMYALLEDADVFVSNVRPAGLARMGLDPDSLTKRFPRLVYGQLTGYGTTGPDVDKAGYDIGAFWSRTGLAHTTVAPDELPPAIRSGQGDHTTGLSMAAGVMAALFDRERTGKGRVVSTSLLRTGIYTLGWDVGVYLRFGKRQSTKSSRKNPAPQMNCYRCADGRAFWLLGMEADRHFPGLLKAIGREELASVDNFKNARARSINAGEFIAVLDEHFATQDYSYWTTKFDENDVWWAPLNSIAEAVADPQVIASGAFVDMTPQPDEEPYRAVNSPVDFSDYTPSYGPVPNLGEHEPKW
ncbi:MAG: CoA transferase [Actinobacteria bacterium]|nr:CoA transferase [Actinomycetota bacterium]